MVEHGGPEAQQGATSRQRQRRKGAEARWTPRSSQAAWNVDATPFVPHSDIIKSSDISDANVENAEINGLEAYSVSGFGDGCEETVYDAATDTWIPPASAWASSPEEAAAMEAAARQVLFSFGYCESELPEVPPLPLPIHGGGGYVVGFDPAIEEWNLTASPAAQGVTPPKVDGNDSPRTSVLTLVGAWGALATKLPPPVQRSELLQYRRQIPRTRKPSALKTLKVDWSQWS